MMRVANNGDRLVTRVSRLHPASPTNGDFQRVVALHLRAKQSNDARCEGWGWSRDS